MQDSNYYSDTLLICADPSIGLMDFGPKTKPVSFSGNTRVVSDVKLPFGLGAFYFDGDSDYIFCGTSGDPDLGGGGDLTIEMYVYPLAWGTDGSFLCSRRQSNAIDIVLHVGTTSLLYTYSYKSNGVLGGGVSATKPIPMENWTHVAVSIKNNVLRSFIAGEMQGETTLSGSNGVGEVFVIGGMTTNANRGFIGYLDQIRFTKGLARYTSNFTPPNSRFETNLDIASQNKKAIKSPSLLWGNKETPAQAWPGENIFKQAEQQTAEKAYGVTTVAMLSSPPMRKDLGFIEGVITRKTAPAVGQHVICLDERFNLVAETLSGAGGYYRFDSLSINGFYAIHAYDNNDYKYAPVGADRRTPEAYS